MVKRFYKNIPEVQKEIDLIKIASVWLPSPSLDQKGSYCVCIDFLKTSRCFCKPCSYKRKSLDKIRQEF